MIRQAKSGKKLSRAKRQPGKSFQESTTLHVFEALPLDWNTKQVTIKEGDMPFPLLIEAAYTTLNRR